jgi:hypothetical protein
MRSNEPRIEVAARVPVDSEGRTARHLGRAKDDNDYLKWREWERNQTPQRRSRVRLPAMGANGR